MAAGTTVASAERSIWEGVFGLGERVLGSPLAPQGRDPLRCSSGCWRHGGEPQRHVQVAPKHPTHPSPPKLLHLCQHVSRLPQPLGIAALATGPGALAVLSSASLLDTASQVPQVEDCCAGRTRSGVETGTAPLLWRNVPINTAMPSSVTAAASSGVSDLRLLGAGYSLLVSDWLEGLSMGDAQSSLLVAAARGVLRCKAGPKRLV